MRRVSWWLVVLLAACGETETQAPDPVAPVAQVVVLPESATVYVGDTYRLHAEARDSAGNLLTGRRVSWTALTPLLLSVDSQGLVRILAPGAARIIATIEGQSDTSNLTSLLRVAQVELLPESASVYAGDTVRLQVEVRDSAGNLLTGRRVIWSTLDPQVALVDTQGLVRGLAAGFAAITATVEGKSDTSTVTAIVLHDRIAFLSTRDGSVQVYVMNSVGSGIQHLAPGTDWNMAKDITAGGLLYWSPDASRLAFRSGLGLAVLPLAGSGLTVLSPFANSAAWAADGSYIRFTSCCLDSTIPVLDVLPDGTDTLQVSETNFGISFSPTDFVYQISWSPDLRQAAFTRARNFFSQVYVADLDGSGLRPLALSNFAQGAPAWSPDGSKIAFWSCEWGIAIINSDGTGQVTPVAPDICQGETGVLGIYTHLSWSPDGKYLAYVRDVTVLGEIWIIDVSGALPPRLIDLGGDDAWSPAWSP